VRDTIELTPTINRRVSHAERKLQVVSVPYEETDGRALLVFMNPEEAEAFRTQTGSYPASEGFEVGAIDVEGLKAILAVWGFEHVALWGPEPDTVSYFGADDFASMLESVSPVEVVQGER
jgi:hypothetical protein